MEISVLKQWIGWKLLDNIVRKVLLKKTLQTYCKLRWSMGQWTTSFLFVVSPSPLDLRTLFHKVYPYTQQGTQEAERLGQLVLVNQFVTGLLEDIKAKVVGIEGGFDQLLSRARFEEAKLRDLAATSSLLPSSNRVGLMSSTQSSIYITANPPGSNNKQQRLTASRFHSGGQRIGVRCYNCGSPSHLVRQCPYADQQKHLELEMLDILQTKLAFQMFHQLRW